MSFRSASVAAVITVMLVYPGGAVAANLYAPTYGTSPEAIAGFARAADGSLAALAGSPFGFPSTDPGGVITLGFTPDGGRAVSTFLFSGGLRGLTVGADGSIAASAPAVDAPSITGLAVSPDGRFAYAPTRDFPPEPPAVGILGYSIGADAALTPLPGSPYSSGEYGDVAITPDGHYLYAAAGQLRHFSIGDDGRLTAAGVPTVIGARYLTPSPDGRFLFAGVSGAADGVTSFTIGADGNLTQNGPPALTGDVSLGYFAVSPDGRHIYMPDSNVDGVVVASVAADGTLAVTGTMPVQNPESVAVSPDGRFMYIGKAGSILVASIAADGTPTLLPSTAAWTSGEPERLTFGPTPSPTAAFTSHEGPPGSRSRFDATGSTGAVRFDWDFGDGMTLVDGGPKPTHTYASAGVYDVALRVYDAQGCSGTFIYTGQSTTCPGGFGTLASSGLDTLPILSRLRAGPRRFVAAAAAVRRPRRGTTFRYRLNERATVKITIARKKGRRFKRVGALRAPGRRGGNRKRFSGKLRGRRLKAGAYRATAVGTDANGGRSRPRSVRFRIVRP